MQENIDYVECKICGFKGEMFGKHFRTVHNLSFKQYKKIYPNAVFSCLNEVEKRRIKQKEWYRNPKNIKDIQKMKEGQSRPHRPHSAHPFNCQCVGCKNTRKELDYSGENNPNAKPKIIRICKACDKEFKSPPAVEHQFCNQYCYFQWLQNPENNPNFDKEFYQQYGTFKTAYPYSKVWSKEFTDKIRTLYNNICVVTGMTNEEHFKKYGRSLSVHHWTYNKNETDPFYFIPVACFINATANNKKHRAQWLDLFNGIAEDRWCELLKEEVKHV